MKRALVKIAAPKTKNKNQRAYETLLQNIENQKNLIANIKKGLSKAYAKIESIGTVKTPTKG